MAYRFKSKVIERKDEQGNVLECVPADYLEGFPARDLSDDDLAGYSKEQLARLKASPLYEEMRAAPPSAPEKPSN